MARKRTQYECSNCGHRTAKWLGRCPDCSQWNTFVEKTPVAETSGKAGARASGARVGAQGAKGPKPVTQLGSEADLPRLHSGITEFDRILGGGLVPGSVTLIGGEPGVGKSTLLLQVAAGLARAGQRVLYASGEESVAQVRDRAERLGGLHDFLYLQSETQLDRVLDGAETIKPGVLVLDSVQTAFVSDVGSTPGSISQVREVASRLVLHAKATNRAVLLVGHVTKSGEIAGPRTLEHIVDAVIYFEGSANPPFRVLRGQKNRFGSTGELGLFEMAADGLREVLEPSAALLQDRPTGRPGTVVAAAMEGSRCLLLEVQALVAPGFPGSVRRTALGVDQGRLAMLVAVLGKADWALHDKEVYVNVVGGVRISETAADLAVAAAILSSLLGRAPAPDWVVLGEIGLTGELRSVPRLEHRLAEAARHGFKRALVPPAPRQFEAPKGIELCEARTIEEAMGVLFR
ncbi:MAG: DNA repair protein RadA [Deltaproteobacteria bacterium]|nr:DNA repair protein RadA [Deltaproteobacteria bacterium]